MPQITFASGLRSERARPARFFVAAPGRVCVQAVLRSARTIIPASDRRPELLPATAFIKGLKILTRFNNQPRPYYASPGVEGQGVAETLSGEDLLSLYLSLPLEKRKQKFASTSEAARMVGLSQRTIQLWVEVGFITAIKIGRKYQVSLDSLRAYLKSRVDY